MGMIRVSDEVEGRLKEVADGRSMSATIEKMLAYCSSPDGFCPVPQEGTNYKPYLLEQMNKRFDELKSLIEDTTVDRLSQGGRAPSSSHNLDKEWIHWDQMQYIIFTHDDDDPAWLVPEGAVFQFKNGDPTSYSYYINDDTIYMENGGRPTPLLKVTPEIQKAIDDKLTYD